MGGLFAKPVRISEVADGKIRPVGFVVSDFDFRHPEIAAAAETLTDQAFPVAGLRLNMPLNQAGVFDELISFLGASYFRALGVGNVYGVSARGLAINCWRPGLDEEFPAFTDFYLERPIADGPLLLHALLDGPSVSGAYRFAVSPGGPDEQETVIDVEANLFFRNDIAELGVAPMTSMYLYSDTDRAGYDDYRPQVHDSSGLLVCRRDGIAAWRALNNPGEVASSYLREPGVLAFGLEQRDRDFSTYQDAEAHYERRPSLICEPLGDWGDGFVRLVETPAQHETIDNIVAFWVPAEPIRAGDARQWRYRLRWGDLPPDPEAPLAHVFETRGGTGGVSGDSHSSDVRKFVIDFRGGPFNRLDPHNSAIDIFTETGEALLRYKSVGAIGDTGIWRVALDIDMAGQPAAELRCYLISGGRQITETWLYQWRREA